VHIQCPPPFTIFTITYKVAVYAPAEKAERYTPLFLPYPYMYSVNKTAAIFREAVKFKQFPASSETEEDQILSRNILDVRYVVKIYLILYTVIYRISLTTV
jgi:hypothetical protein